jgi:hypothetical protein
VVFFFSF